jgi:uncharacterized CHY-type Zn-finger protein
MKMVMTRRGGSGQITEYTSEDNGPIVCKACSAIIISKENLGANETCPYCHNNVNMVLSEDNLIDEDGEDIAIPC